MTDADLATAEYWAHFWSTIEYWAFFGVVATLALEFMATKFAKPHIAFVEASQKQALEDRKQDNLKLSLQVEEEKQRRLALENAVASNSPALSVAQRDALIEKLRRFPTQKGGEEVFIFVDFSTTRTASLYAILLDVFEGVAGWYAKGEGTKDIPTPFEDGVVINVPAKSDVMDCLAASLVEYGIPARVELREPTPSVLNPPIIIKIGKVPQ